MGQVEIWGDPAPGCDGAGGQHRAARRSANGSRCNARDSGGGAGKAIGLASNPTAVTLTSTRYEYDGRAEGMDGGLPDTVLPVCGSPSGD